MRLLLSLQFVIVFQITFSQPGDGSCYCCAETYRQFDFWVGNWEVHDSTGTLIGHNTIELIQDSCGLQESWVGTQGTTGTSISYYDRQTGKWYQNWVAAHGGVIMMEGKPENGAMVLYSRQLPGKNGDDYVQSKISWTPLKDGRVRQLWLQTTDSGITWKVVFDGYYSRVE